MTREEAIRRVECCRDFLANNYSDMGEPNYMALDMAIKALEREPKTGHWILHKEISVFSDMYKCSECGIINGNHFYNFCPNCGADMRGDADEDSD